MLRPAEGHAPLHLPCSHAPVARSLIFQVPNGPQGRGYIIQALLIIQGRSRRGFAQFKLVAHFLEAGSKSFNLFLLLGYGRFLFCSGRL